MDVDSRVLASETPTLVSPGKITIHHAQLRDLIVCPHERGVVDYIQDESIVRHNLSSGSVRPSSSTIHYPLRVRVSPPGNLILKGPHVHTQDPIQLAKFQFRPVNLTSLTLPGASHTLYASGGFNGDIHISLHAPYPSTQALWEFNTRLEMSMNNSVLLTSQVPGSEEPRLVVGNNNNSVNVFDVPVRTRLETLSECGFLELDYPVNHCSISPDGRTLLTVGDSREISLHALSCGGSSITFERTSTLYLPSLPKSIYTDARPRYYPALFSSAFSSDGTKFAVSSQEGTVVVWDIRSSLPLKVIQTDRTRGCSERPRMTSRCGWCTRSLKFGHGGRAGKEVMVFNEQTSLLHIVDGQTFETEQVIDVSGLVDGEAQLAGLCFDPSGEFVYTGTTTSIAEWKLM